MMPTIRENLYHNRFKDAPWYNINFATIEHAAMVGGAGGIGSWLSLLLARAGFFPYVCDFDTIEEHNIGGQLFSKHQIGIRKCQAVRDNIATFCGIDIYTDSTPIGENANVTKWTFSAFDKMKPRKDLFESWYENYGQYHVDAIFIDGRLTAEHMQILCIKGKDEAAIKKYREEYLFGDEEVEDAPCTFRQTSHSAAMIASHMVGFFTNHVANYLASENVRDVPFYWEYLIPMNYLEVKNP